MPLHGARSACVTGSREIPSPTIFLAKTGSGTVSIGTSTPESGAKSVIEAGFPAEVEVFIVRYLLI
jgi:hypothetical protein